MHVVETSAAFLAVEGKMALSGGSNQSEELTCWGNLMPNL